MALGFPHAPRTLLEEQRQADRRAAAAGEDDYFVLKPRHSGFHSTTLEVLLAYLGANTLVLTGVAANNCVLFTAHDAYMREFRLLVPGDCVASESEADDRYALEHMAKVLKAETSSSAGIDFRRYSTVG
jgi:nicotinamidase-related amidase